MKLILILLALVLLLFCGCSTQTATITIYWNSTNTPPSLVWTNAPWIVQDMNSSRTFPISVSSNNFPIPLGY